MKVAPGVLQKLLIFSVAMLLLPITVYFCAKNILLGELFFLNSPIALNFTMLASSITGAVSAVCVGWCFLSLKVMSVNGIMGYYVWMAWQEDKATAPSETKTDKKLS